MSYSVRDRSGNDRGQLNVAANAQPNIVLLCTRLVLCTYLRQRAARLDIATMSEPIIHRIDDPTSLLVVGSHTQILRDALGIKLVLKT